MYKMHPSFDLSVYHETIVSLMQEKWNQQKLTRNGQRKFQKWNLPQIPRRWDGSKLLYVYIFSNNFPLKLTLLWPVLNSHTYRAAKGADKDLYAMISQRRDERKDKFESMFSSLVSRYGSNADSEPNEEEFEAAQKKVESKRSSKKSRRK